jgi:hypothetical protein
MIFTKLISKPLMLSIALAASINDAEASEIPAKFVDFHDPGVIELAIPNGEVINGHFYYDSISYNEISKWNPNEEVFLTMSPTLGEGVIRAKTGSFHRVLFFGTGPLDLQADQCVENHASTASITECYSQVIEHWEVEIKARLETLKQHLPEDVMKTVETDHEAWKDRIDTFKSAVRANTKTNNGTIYSIKAAASIVALYANYALSLNVFM